MRYIQQSKCHRNWTRPKKCHGEDDLFKGRPRKSNQQSNKAEMQKIRSMLDEDESKQ